jgi:predicted metal-binding membrane protein
MRTVQTTRTFAGVSAALFFGSAALTIAWCHSMSAMRDMPICTTRMDSTMSMHNAVGFLVMWLTMMMAMRFPSLLPMLSRYRHAVGATTAAQVDMLTAVVGCAYFFVWTVFGVFVYAASSMMPELESHWPSLVRVIPMATGAIVLTAGALQFSRWKAHHLACCRSGPHCCDRLPPQLHAAWRHGIRLGVHCVHCCFGLTLVLLAVGMMDLRAMLLVTFAISLERLAPRGLHIARLTGGVLVVAGLFLIARAML